MGGWNIQVRGQHLLRSGDVRIHQPARAGNVSELVVDSGMNGERRDEAHDGDGNARRTEDGTPWSAGDEAQPEQCRHRQLP